MENDISDIMTPRRRVLPLLLAIIEWQLSMALDVSVSWPITARKSVTQII